ncbi:MAG TPA: four helix bundle protein [Tenuifilaceae bacterium]|nr:four helix bundle protein [Tenuifilaceae bacterium]HPE17322.1 four helix bundle protein [Tenuifilaceae bacterium]HPJ44548.1 four helix bundle protein [Tenuifilaceae bacterium]HPQ34855.1 four helix bundle protein [Tenuifilaceae bacterium]HRX67630.1 four helix bundle protein [Tenuifilaceae bacterium]
MENKEFAKELEKRTKVFAVKILRLSAKLPKTVEARVIRNQISKSGTSVGANYREANRSRSKADFISRLRICESEASETVYWLEIIQEFLWIEEKEILEMLNEANELLAIFCSIGKTLKN